MYEHVNTQLAGHRKIRNHKPGKIVKISAKRKAKGISQNAKTGLIVAERRPATPKSTEMWEHLRNASITRK
jgi:hypothetical protein